MGDDYWSHTPEPVRCLVLCPYLTHKQAGELNGKGDAPLDQQLSFQHERAPEANLEEAVNLTQAIQLDVVDAQIVSLKEVQSSALFGKGVVERFAEAIQEQKIELVVVDYPLSPGQQRNLERAWQCKVIDRTGLILEIFGERAQTKEGKLQVELAQLEYQKSRLVRAWTHLERQRATGKTGGPGEKQIELDKRLIAERISRLKKDLRKVEKTRKLQRKNRETVPYPVVSLVGYTNAGKSTLFNRLSGADVMVKNMLFATLDPTMREVVLPSGKKIILSDTVGFISNLPTQLIAAFKATLEEVLEADIILHVRDISSPSTRAEKKDVLAILDDLEISEEQSQHMIEVLNKSDLLPGDQKDILHNQVKTQENNTVLVSALTGQGVPDLLELIDRLVSANDHTVKVTLPVLKGKAVSWLFDNADILHSITDDGGDNHPQITLTARISSQKLGQFKAQFGQDARLINL